MEGIGRGLVWSSIPAFAWSGYGKRWKTVVRMCSRGDSNLSSSDYKTEASPLQSACPLSNMWRRVSWKVSTDVSEEHVAAFFVSLGGNRLLQSFGTCLPNYTASSTRRQSEITNKKQMSIRVIPLRMARDRAWLLATCILCLHRRPLVWWAVAGVWATLSSAQFDCFFTYLTATFRLSYLVSNRGIICEYLGKAVEGSGRDLF
jgi:hypothetical protein